jgi:hypothetical protein
LCTDFNAHEIPEHPEGCSENTLALLVFFAAPRKICDFSYFNSTSQTSGSSSDIDVDELDAPYLFKSGGTVSSNLIVSGSVDVKTALTLPAIGNVESTIQGNQNTINDGDLTIARTTGLQTALEGKQNTINDGDLTIANTSGLLSALEGKQNSINDGDLTIAKTSGLQSALNGKHLRERQDYRLH